MNFQNNTSLHILLAHHQGKIAGAERSILNLLTFIDRDHFRFTVACPAPTPLSQEMESLDIPVIHCHFSRVANLADLLRNAFTLTRIITKNDIALLHGNGPQTNLPCGLAGRLVRRPILWHSRNILEPGMIDLDRYLSFLATHIVSNSQAIRDRFKNLSDYDMKTSVILNGVNTTEFAPLSQARESIRQKEGIAERTLVLGMFDRLDPRKNHEDVIDACVQLCTTVPDFLLMIVGEAFIKHEERLRTLRARAKNQGIGDRMRFLGFRIDVAELMNACDVIVLAARHEGCSRTLCEAQATGVPVIAADDGGNRELVADGESGLLFPVGDSKALSEKLIELFNNPQRRRAMGRAARSRAEDKLSIQRHCNQMEALYRQLADTRTAPAAPSFKPSSP